MVVGAVILDIIIIIVNFYKTFRKSFFVLLLLLTGLTFSSIFMIHGIGKVFQSKGDVSIK